MNALRSSPFRPLLPASALQLFIFSCWLLPLAWLVPLADRQVFMYALRSSPLSPCVFASALQLVIFSCWLFWASAASPASSASAAPIPNSQVEPLMAFLLYVPEHRGAYVTSNGRARSMSARLLHLRVGTPPALLDEALHTRRQHRQRHGAEIEHRVVKGADVEGIAKRLLPQRARLQ